MAKWRRYKNTLVTEGYCCEGAAVRNCSADPVALGYFFTLSLSAASLSGFRESVRLTKVDRLRSSELSANSCSCAPEQIRVLPIFNTTDMHKNT